jgi:hypothetical protein
VTASRLISVFCSIALAACSTQSTPTQLNLRSVYQSQHCGDETAGLRWLARDAFTALVRGPGTVQHLGAATVPAIAEAETLLLVSLGQKNSGGHGISLASEQAPIEGGTVELPLRIQQPAAGGFQTMQLTTPCLVIALPSGEYSRITAGTLGELSVSD